ncbi:nuclear transport factor 2 family protein [Arthrobacter bambusae]|jgi:hypothetical protein|uniref:SnoaL-like domain-containing protein n=1 Tax=Arthrobacter bambusae TaxID=1338426 RepID=A0AAW8DJK3_9MICC|nr:hypothetical protein [Arthrobacter bambusae]MDQ0130296.1 hypothetical protein [Arthrobacter bambusae]MDQ0181783.1 hypothetical protein [Arthrobacter bambusae]
MSVAVSPFSVSAGSVPRLLGLRTGPVDLRWDQLSRGGLPLSEANKELVRRHFQEIWNQRQLDVCEQIMADSYVEHAQAPFGTTEPGAVVGPQAMRATVQWLLAQFPDMTMTHVRASIALVQDRGRQAG